MSFLKNIFNCHSGKEDKEEEEDETKLFNNIIIAQEDARIKNENEHRALLGKIMLSIAISIQNNAPINIENITHLASQNAMFNVMIDKLRTTVSFYNTSKRYHINDVFDVMTSENCLQLRTAQRLMSAALIKNNDILSDIQQNANAPYKYTEKSMISCDAYLIGSLNQQMLLDAEEISIIADIFRAWFVISYPQEYSCFLNLTWKTAQKLVKNEYQ
jgi:hypothetical protein